MGWYQEAFGEAAKERVSLQQSGEPPPLPLTFQKSGDLDFIDPQVWGLVLLGPESAFCLRPPELLRTLGSPRVLVIKYSNPPVLP